MANIFIAMGLIFLISVSLLAEAAGQTQLTENTLRLDQDTAPASVELSSFDWLVGRWVGEGLDGECEECFLPVWNNTMFGTFRYAKDGALVFSEFFSLVKSDDGVAIKLKHFNPDFTGWEEKNDSVTFPLIRVEERAAYFGGLTYRLTDDGDLNVWVAMRNRDGEFNDAAFVFRRAELIESDKTRTTEPTEPIRSTPESVAPAPPAEPKGVSITNQDRILRKSISANCTREHAWSLWTTSEGIAQFFSPDSKIELKPGAPYEIYFGLEPDEHGLRGSEGSRVVSLIPNEFIIFEWAFPPNAPTLRGTKKKIHVKLQFESVSSNETRVELTHFGWEDGAEWDTSYKYFDKVWPIVLYNFKQAAESKK